MIAAIGGLLGPKHSGTPARAFKFVQKFGEHNLGRTLCRVMNKEHLKPIPKNGLRITPAALKLKDACSYLGGISPSAMRRLIRRGLVKANRGLRHILIPVAELDRFLREGYL